MTWWQRKTINVDALLMWVFGVLVAGLFLLWSVTRWECQPEINWSSPTQTYIKTWTPDEEFRCDRLDVEGNRYCEPVHEEEAQP